jgi:O-antigen ligase
MMYLRQRKRRFLVGFAVTFAAMAISLSRGALLGSMVALLVIAYYNRKFIDRESSGRLAMAMVAIALTVAPAVLGLWSERFSSVEISDISADVTTRDRVVTLGLAYEGISEHPLLGGGTSSYQLEFGGDEFGQPGEAAWIANTEMRVLYDTGVLGLGLFIAFFVSLVIGVKRLLKKAPNLELQALTMAFVVYLISFQFTEGTMLAFSWVHLGLIAAGIAVFRNAKGDTQNVVSGATVRPRTNN